MNHKPTFFTSDWHIGHEQSIEFDERPFADLQAMHEALVRRYNAVVPPTGVCYFLGDVGNKTSDMGPVIRSLNGIKVLLLGNHDHGMTTMYNVGFDVVIQTASIWVANQKVTMSHCPLLGITREDTSGFRGGIVEAWHGSTREKHLRSTVKDEGQFHLHGHIHSRKTKVISQKILGRQYDVGVTANGYKPVSLSEIESWITKTLKEKS